MTSFREAFRQAEETEILAACRRARLGDDDTAYILARYRDGSYSHDLLTAIGGTADEYVAMMVEARPPYPEPVFRLG